MTVSLQQRSVGQVYEHFNTDGFQQAALVAVLRQLGSSRHVFAQDRRVPSPGLSDRFKTAEAWRGSCANISK